MRYALATMVVGYLLLAPSTYAVLCTSDPVPAATLLIPSFTVDISPQACADGNGLTTLISVNNALPSPQIAHVTLWTDQSVPAIDFDIYLTGFDVQTLNLRDVFCRGVLPQTGFAISPIGTISDPAVAFPSCNNTATAGSGPFYDNPFAPVFVEFLQEWFTGRPSTSLGTCAGSGQAGPSTAVGYITIDQATDCSLQFPSDAAYYEGTLGFENALWGDYAFQDPANDFAQGFHAVHIEAAPTDFFADGDRTFYGRYHNASAVDRREPLPTTYRSRFAQGGAFDETTLHVWREADETADDYACDAAGPSWWPLDFTNPFSFAWNEREDLCELFVSSFGLSDPLPVGTPLIDVPNAVNLCTMGDLTGACRIEPCDFLFGWVLLNLQSSASVYDDGIAQAHVTTVTQASGRYSIGIGAQPLDAGCDERLVPVPGPTPLTLPAAFSHQASSAPPQ